MDTEMPIKQNKVKINATISPRLRDKALALSDGNLSSFVSEAIAYYAGALEKERMLKQKESDDSVKSKQAKDNDLAMMFLKLIANHPELLPELTGKQSSKRQNNNDDDDYETEEYLNNFSLFFNYMHKTKLIYTF